MCVSPGDQWPLWAGQAAAACPVSSSRLSWFSENFSPLATDHPPPCAGVECSVCTSQAHYNANDTAAAQWSFMSSLFTTSNVCPLLHTFAFYRLYGILYQIKCCGDESWFYWTMEQKASALIKVNSIIPQKRWWWLWYGVTWSSIRPCQGI